MIARALRQSSTQASRYLAGTQAPARLLASPAFQCTSSPRHNTIAFASRRWHSTSELRHKQYQFGEVKEISGSPSGNRIIIDVREPSEYEAGYIPGAINIPVKSQPDAMFLSPEEFEDRFGFSKPSPEKEIVFYCKAGVRSSAAAQLAQQQGYKNISEYRGSWLDWTKNGGPIEKP